MSVLSDVVDKWGEYAIMLARLGIPSLLVNYSKGAEQCQINYA